MKPLLRIREFIKPYLIQAIFAVIVLLILTFASISSAQGFKLGAAGTVAFPTGDWRSSECLPHALSTKEV